MKVDLADKESLEARRAQHVEESRENCKLISEQKAVRKHSSFFKCLYNLLFAAKLRDTNFSQSNTFLWNYLQQQRCMFFFLFFILSKSNALCGTHLVKVCKQMIPFHSPLKLFSELTTKIDQFFIQFLVCNLLLWCKLYWTVQWD